MKISIIVAMASNRVIGFNNQMPWHLSADLKKFKQITMGSPIIMGRKTYESIGRPLPGRQNVVISRSASYHPNGCQVFNSLDSAIQAFSSYEDIFVIGGATLYQALLPKASYLYITQINKHFDGDTYFPDIDAERWRTVSREDIDNDDSVDFTYSFIKLERIR